MSEPKPSLLHKIEGAWFSWMYRNPLLNGIISLVVFVGLTIIVPYPTMLIVGGLILLRLVWWFILFKSAFK